MADFGDKASISGQNVLTATGDNLILTSKDYTFKQQPHQSAYSGSETVPAGDYNDGVGGSINHGLSYVPAYEAFAKGDDGRYFRLPGRSRSDTKGTSGIVGVTATLFEHFLGFQDTPTVGEATIEFEVGFYTDLEDD